jgi:hypothetical protein
VGFVTILLPSLALGIVLTFLVWAVLRVIPEQCFILGLTVSQ